MIKNIFHHTKLLTLIAVLLLGAWNSYSQEKKHQFSVSAGGVFSYVDYNLEQQRNLNPGNGMSLGLRYSYYLTENWSIGLGAEYQTFNSSVRFGSIQHSYMTTDSEGESFEFRYTAERFNEKQSLKYVNIPLTLQYEGSDYPSLYVSAGAKVGFAIKSTYETSIENLSTSGYYPQFDVELFDPQFAGFGNFGSITPGKQDLDLNVSYMATFEAGVKQYEDEKIAVYIGLYFDYGLNSIVKDDSKKEIVEYPRELPVNLEYNSLVNSSLADDARLMAYGVKVRIAL